MRCLFFFLYSSSSRSTSTWFKSVLCYVPNIKINKICNNGDSTKNCEQQVGVPIDGIIDNWETVIDLTSASSEDARNVIEMLQRLQILQS